MSINLLTIVPNEGLGDLKIGMTRKEVKALIGTPDEVENAPFYDDEGPVEIWHYDEHDISIVFNNDPKSTLDSIAITSPETTLYGKNIIDKTFVDVMQILEEENLGEYEREDFDEDGEQITLLCFNDEQMELWFENGKLSEIKI